MLFLILSVLLRKSSRVFFKATGGIRSVRVIAKLDESTVNLLNSTYVIGLYIRSLTKTWLVWWSFWAFILAGVNATAFFFIEWQFFSSKPDAIQVFNVNSKAFSGSSNDAWWIPIYSKLCHFTTLVCKWMFVSKIGSVRKLPCLASLTPPYCFFFNLNVFYGPFHWGVPTI